ncbi:MAG: bifunctional diaminohydroxyphosphoribosylaminopyrimidine deaminase/5-amino-6-(5-phosphoribosylamino)uracil reductase RibD [Bacteroidales bacterium]|nr:bifunctional diaminohydroxyphosphoribosylaminopyrimidine deaminase/5-amino-6-(5-phosphoribosylamino)uracil reductase RibD [Bacteroidales bacterium]
MRRCLELAVTASGYTAPNPMVGAVVVCDGSIIGEGFHRQYGEPHAEVNAIHSVREPERLERSTLYVNLEPCSHHGKTPPCADLIIASRIPHVVVGSFDPNPLVAGRGIAKLRAAGCQVTEHVLETECDRLNVRFMTFHRKRRPYVALKWAQTSDGFIDTARDRDVVGRPTWITGWYEQTLVHKWRSEEQAIMVGTNTALADNPMLNVRRRQGHQPLRVVLDRQLRLPASLHLFDGTVPTLVFTEKQHPDTAQITYAIVPFDSQLPQHILDELFRRNITSVLIEGGTQLLQTFIDAELWDEARVFTGTALFGDGVKAPVMPLLPAKESTCGDSTLRMITRRTGRI